MSDTFETDTWRVEVERGRSLFGQRYMVYLVAGNNRTLMWTEKLSDITYARAFGATIADMMNIALVDNTGDGDV